MPACEPWCPIVKTELRKIVAEAPWIRDEPLSSSVKVREGAPLLEPGDGKPVPGPVDAKWGGKGQKPTSDPFDDQKSARYRQQPEWLDVMDADDVKYAKGSGADMVSRGQMVGQRKMEEDAATFTSKADLVSARTTKSRGQDPLASSVSTKGTGTKQIKTNVAASSAIGLSGRETTDAMQQHPLMETREGPAAFPDECEPTCPRRISRESRIRKLEERQRSVDAYLLNKGANYFDDVCTCSLSCVVRALKDDSFIRSIVTSVALFTLGLKLCMELNSWHLPIRLS